MPQQAGDSYRGETTTELVSGMYYTKNVMVCMWTSNLQDSDGFEEYKPVVAVRRECKGPVQRHAVAVCAEYILSWSFMLEDKSFYKYNQPRQ